MKPDFDVYKTISLETFLECYKPICNDCTPVPPSKLKEVFGDVIWDKRDYSRIGNELSRKTIWSIFEEDDKYVIISTIFTSMSNELYGYIVTEFPYRPNSFKVIIYK